MWLLLMPMLFALCTGAKILVMMPNPAPSFTRSFQPLTRELATRGHLVTAYTTVPLPPPVPPTYSEIIIDNIFITSPRMVDYLKDIKDSSNSGLTLYTLFLWEFGLIVGEEILKIPVIQKLINSDESFDLIIDNPLILLEPIAGFRYKFNCPSVNLFPNSPNQMLSEITGNPQPYAYIPYHNLPYTSSMDLWQRIRNTYMGILSDIGNQLYYLPYQDETMRRYFNDTNMPPLKSILRNSHISLLDTHLLMDYPRPYLPGTVLVGGMATPKTNKISEELNRWLDEADNGVVYFSMGSVMKFGALSSANRAVILKTLGSLKQHVLMKLEHEDLQDLPKNVRGEPWVSQADVLAHPNCRLFVSHGGIHSVMEALHYSVPVVGLPVFGDQIHNMVNLQWRGVGVYLLLDNLTEDAFTAAINQVLLNETFYDNARRLSAITQDQVMTPLQTAVYWVEYALRHNGAPHLASNNTTLLWYQQWLLDVVIFSLVSISLLALSVWFAVKATLIFILSLYSAKRKKRKI